MTVAQNNSLTHLDAFLKYFDKTSRLFHVNALNNRIALITVCINFGNETKKYKRLENEAVDLQAISVNLRLQTNAVITQSQEITQISLRIFSKLNSGKFGAFQFMGVVTNGKMEVTLSNFITSEEFAKFKAKYDDTQGIYGTLNPI